MTYIVYKTTNLINNKIYIGVHRTKVPEKFDGYFGSNSYLKNSITKYGAANFQRETLYEFSSADEAFDKERELVNEEFCKREYTYNFEPGGRGNVNLGKTVVERKVGIHSDSYTIEMRRESSRKMIANRDKEELRKSSSLGGKLGGKRNKELGVGIFGRSEEKIKEDARRAIATQRENKLGRFNSELQSKWSKLSSGSKGIKKYNDGVTEYSYTTKEQSAKPFEEFLLENPRFLRGYIKGRGAGAPRKTKGRKIVNDGIKNLTVNSLEEAQDFIKSNPEYRIGRLFVNKKTTK